MCHALLEKEKKRIRHSSQELVVMGFLAILSCVLLCGIHLNHSARNCTTIYSEPNRALLGSNFSTVDAANAGDCNIKCEQDENCRSANYWLLEKKCDLNNASRIWFPSRLKRAIGCIYASIRPRIFCQSGWKRFNDSCYWADTREMAWNDARAACGDMGGDLVQIASKEENEFVYGLGSGTMWIGLKRAADGFRWVVDNSLASYTEWHPGEPVASICVYMGYGGQMWDDYSCEVPKKFICEITPRL
ncbi:C-type lectin domain family 4 member E [Nematostella vectensis]|uniref:C-type lectin domain family 4 member E n=1 Tax=Nematostella vectensis TaxID=45351 RepID=UPI002077404A|nr:C-type lectin domain family 4 member E [Nematostella vectensis]